MPFVANEIGKRIYLWSRKKGAQSPGVKQCVISAHGGQSKINGMGNTNNAAASLVYYAPHGYILTDPSLMGIMDGSAKPVETVVSTSSQDYELSKYQGRHGSKSETYERIGGMAERIEEDLANMELAIGQFKSLGKDSRAEEVEARLNKMKNKMDIVTIRNRRFVKGDVLLSEVVNGLAKAGYKYDVIHCSFCRCRQEDDFSYNPVNQIAKNPATGQTIKI